jgi:uncharacterized membrane protein
MLKTIHSFWAYLVVIMLFIATVNVIIGFVQKKMFASKDFSFALLTLILSHTQFLIGVFLLGLNNQFGEMTMRDIMSTAPIRLTHIEHPLVMLIAIVMITIGYSKHKKTLTSQKKFKTLSIFYTLAFVLVLSRIPWSNWLA